MGIFSYNIKINTFEMIKEKTIRPEDKKVVSLWMDTYDNIFSDFDPRPYSQRALSDDFLIEAKKVVHEYKPGEFDLTFLVPTGKRDKATEELIKERLHSYFKKQEHQLNKEYKEKIQKGIRFTVIGALCLITGAWALYLEERGFLLSLARVILEPSGWFLAWYGMDHIMYHSNTDKYEREFSDKMSRAEIVFESFTNR
jgi:hypothetical protein